MRPDELPRVVLPAPLGAAVITGAIRVVLQDEPTTWRGQVWVVQSQNQDQEHYRRIQRCLRLAAQKRFGRQANAYLMRNFPWTIYSQVGILGWAELVDCVDMEGPRRLPWKEHYNGGLDRLEHRWAWVLRNPHLARPGREDTPPTQGQQTLFV